MNIPDQYDVTMRGSDHGAKWEQQVNFVDLEDVIRMLRRYRGNLRIGQVVTEIIIKPMFLEGGK